jgi:hypothetical protein
MKYKSIIKRFVIKTLLKLSGLRAWVASIVFNIVWKKIIIPIINHFKVTNEVKKDAKDYEKVVNNPKSSADDVRNAFDDFNKH